MTTPKKRMSLAEYARRHPKQRSGSRGWLETIPEFDEVVAAYRAGVHASVIRRWLQDPPEKDGCGYGKAASENTVGGWLRRHVEREDAEKVVG